MADTLVPQSQPSQDPAGNGLFNANTNRLKRMDDAVTQAQTGSKTKPQMAEGTKKKFSKPNTAKAAMFRARK
jgi:hypothetical protein